MFKHILSIAFTVIILFSAYNNSNAQGCSDGGACSFTMAGHNEEKASFNHQFSFGIGYGLADNDINTISNYFEYSLLSIDDFKFGIKLTSLVQDGKEASEFGLSDIILNSSYSINDNVSSFIGLKIPLNNSDKEKYGVDLPMDYQSSLGTFDIIFGGVYSIDNFGFSLAAQIPLTDNDNMFFTYDLHPLAPYINTNKFIRKPDILFRASYLINISEEITFTPSILPIYHLGNDTYRDLSNVKREIEGSSGLTLNTNFVFDYKFNTNNSLQLNIAFPLKVRDKRPDGLTRSFISNLAYTTRL